MMTPKDLRRLSELAELKMHMEQARLQPELTTRRAVMQDIADLRRKLAETPAHPEDPVAMLWYTEHAALLESRLRERLRLLSRLEAQIAIKSPALARATARKDVADKLLEDAEADRKKQKEAARQAQSNQLTS
jgi:hypothetical protein